MNCKYCNAPLADDSLICPSCGGNNAEEATAAEETVAAEETTITGETAVTEETAGAEEAAVTEETTITEEAEAVAEKAAAEECPAGEKKKIPLWAKITAAAVGGVILLGVLVCAVLYGLGVDLKPRANDIRYKDSYSVSEKKASKVEGTVIAKIGDRKLTNADLQPFYWMVVNNRLEYFGYYASMLGLDTTKSFAEQACTLEEGLTWQQYFLRDALTAWQQYTVLSMLAEEEGFTLSDEVSARVEAIPEQLRELAETYNFESAEAMVQADFGPLCTMDAYMNYVRLYNLAALYQQKKADEVQPTDDELAAYYEEDKESLESQGITKDALYYDVRHILIAPEGGTTDDAGTTTYTDAEWEACRKKAQELLDKWASGEATEDSFAALAKENSTDPGSASNGGLYTDLTTETSFVDEFKQWYLDENRKVGDTGLVKSIYGYHIMYFSGTQERWRSETKTAMTNAKIDELIKNATDRYPMQVNYKKIALGEPKQPETEETQPTETTVPQTTAATNG